MSLGRDDLVLCAGTIPQAGLVERMEEGELSLEDSLKSYERGIELSRACQKSLDTAEQRIQILSEKDGADETQRFPPDDD